MKIANNARIFWECGDSFTLRDEGPPLFPSEACLASTATNREYPLQNFLDVGVNRNVRLRKTADLKRLPGGFAEVKKTADVVILVEHVENAFGLFVRKAERFDGDGFSVCAG